MRKVLPRPGPSLCAATLPPCTSTRPRRLGIEALPGLLYQRQRLVAGGVHQPCFAAFPGAHG
jgi:hypothetical protein